MAKPITIQEIRTRAIALWGVRGWQAELSRKLPMSTHQVNKIMNNYVKLSPRTANHIELLIKHHEAIIGFDHGSKDKSMVVRGQVAAGVAYITSIEEERNAKTNI